MAAAAQRAPNLLIRLRFGGRLLAPPAPSAPDCPAIVVASSMHHDHPVLHCFEAQLTALRDQYLRSPNEQTRYQLVRIEQRIAQWAPEAISLQAAAG
jgi:hypothetical protein